jgi:hypothetical protein
VSALLANFLVVFTPSAGEYLGAGQLLLSDERRRPLVRSDIEELRRMAGEIERLVATGNGSVYVLASSDVFSDDILRHASEDANKHCQVCEQIVRASHVDKRDGLRRAFWDAKWVIVADPIQYHLRPEDQTVVGILADELLHPKGIGLAYAKRPYQFALDGGVTIYVYEKVRPFEKEAVENIGKQFLAHYPDAENLFDRPGGT